MWLKLECYIIFTWSFIDVFIFGTLGKGSDISNELVKRLAKVTLFPTRQKKAYNLPK